MSNKPKILVIHGKSGCCFWRTYQFCTTAQKLGLADVRILETKTMTQQEVAEGLAWCDIAHIRGLLDTVGYETVLRYQQVGVKVATDHDDLHFNVSPFNPAYKNFGLEEVKARDPKTGDEIWLWQDGKEGFDLKRNQQRFHSYKAILQQCDLVTTTTLYLRDALMEIAEGNMNCRVVPNAINFDQWKPLPGVREKYKDKFRFGWAVSNSHGEDWLHIRPVLKEFLESNPDAKFVCIGDASMDITTSLPKDQVEWSPFSDLWELHYPYRMAMLGLDVAIAPLADLEFNKCKSPLKYEEYTAFGWPVIAQNMEPYSSHIIHGDTGLLASNTNEWLGALSALKSNPELRKKLAFNANLAVREMFDLNKVVNEWVSIYQETISGVKVS